MKLVVVHHSQNLVSKQDYKILFTELGISDKAFCICVPSHWENPHVSISEIINLKNNKRGDDILGDRIMDFVYQHLKDEVLVIGMYGLSPISIEILMSKLILLEEYNLSIFCLLGSFHDDDSQIVQIGFKNTNQNTLLSFATLFL